jgi:2-polyprenyl-6-methoxyphenol hydroxylase-like FAD-dependent oxidoreductase
VQKFINEYIKPQEPYAKIAESVEVINLEGGTINTIPSKDPYNLFKSHLLADANQQAKYETEKWVQAVRSDGDELVVVYSDTTSEAQHELRADLVIAADGAHSAIRETVVPGQSPQYVGFLTWRGAVPAAVVSEASRKVLEGRILMFRTEDGYTVS